jgi:hypothetical protein
MKNHSLIIAAIAILLGLFFGTPHSLALTISPPVTEINGDPGSTVQGALKLYNETKQEAVVYGSTANFKAKENGAGEPEFIDLDEQIQTKDLASWLKIPSGNFTIKPLDWQTVIFEINIPKNAEPGGHYAAVFFSPNNPAINGDGTVSLNYKAGGLILLSVSGDVKQEGSLKSFFVKDNKRFFESIPVAMQLVVGNNGNLHFRPGGAIEVRNIFGQKVTDLPILNSDTGGNVLPQSTRRYDITWGETDAKNLPQGFWKKAKYEFKNFHLGLYKAKAIVALPLGKNEFGDLSFWIVPWQLLIVMFFSLVVFVLLFRQYNRWIIKKAREGKK